MTTTPLKTTAQVARLIGCSPRTVVRLVERGAMKPAQKLPGKRGGFLFDDAEIRRALKVTAERAIEAIRAGGEG